MTIVTRNSLTVSNVNDGTITHVAYANSADGTLDFNPDYKSAVGLDILNFTSWAKNTSMSSSTYNFVSNADRSFKVTGKGTSGYEVLSKSFPAKVGDKLRFTVRYTNRLAFGLFNNYGLQFVTSGAYTESTTSTSKIVLPNAITASTEYQLEYTATTSNVWMQLNFGGVSDSAQVDFDVKIEVENLTNPVKYAYMGTYSDYTATDSIVPTDYKWSRILGEDGPSGVDGNPGKIVSDTEPTTRFKGLTWKYSGTADLTASDGTVIKPNTEYYYNGTHWMINYLSANNIEANSIKADKIDAKNLTITDGEFVSTTTNGPVTTSTEIKDNHIAISKTDGTVNTRNDIALDSEQGLAQKFTNIDTGFYRTAGINYQGPFTSDSDGNYAQLTPQGTKLSTDVPWTTLAATGGFSGGTIQFSVQNGVAYFSVSGLSVPAMTGNNWYQCAQLPTGSSAIPSVNRVTTAFGNASVWGFYVSKNGGLYFQSKTSVSATASLANALAAFPIG